jgi:AcrR family transcriptional regulator
MGGAMGGTRQARAVETQQHLLAAARQVFGERGYRGTSVAAITEAASTAHGTFYLYFRNKEDAFLQLLASSIDELYRGSFAALDSDDLDGGADAVAAGVAELVALAERERGLVRALLEGAVESPAIAARWMEVRAPFVEGVAADLRARQQRGTMRPIDADLAAASLCGMVEWLVFTSAAFEVPQPLADADRMVSVVSDLWVAAVGPDQAASTGEALA